MTLSERLKKGLIHTGVIPLAILLTGCPEKLPEDFSIENIRKIRQMKCEIKEIPAEPYKINAQQLRSDPRLTPGWEITFRAWYGLDTTKEPDYVYTHPKRKDNRKKAYSVCDAYLDYVKKIQQQDHQTPTFQITFGGEF